MLPSTNAFAALLALAAAIRSLPQASGAEAGCCTATIRARVPAGTGRVYLSGNLDELGPWRSVRITTPAGTALEYKFTLGSWDREALTAAGKFPLNYQLTLTRDTACSTPASRTPAWTGGVDEAVVRLAKRGVIPPIIVVGVWSGPRRGFEYSPWADGPDYARFLIEELMPRVNRTFRTLTGPEHTAVMGHP